MSNMFATAKSVVAPASKAKKSNKAEVILIGLEELGAIDAAIKTLLTLKETIEADVKAGVKTYFIDDGVEVGKRPINFTGLEGVAKASCELRARASSSPLSADEQVLFQTHGIPTETVDTVIETFIINPTYAADGELLEKIGKAISKVKGVPEDFIQKQEGKSKVIAGANALDVLFSKKDKGICREMFSMVGVLALKVTVSDMPKALNIVKDVLFPKA